MRTLLPLPTIAILLLLTLPAYAAGLNYAVHVASFKQERGAAKMVLDLKEQGYEAFYTADAVPDEKLSWCRVYVGSFEDRESAEKVAVAIRRDGVSDYSNVRPLLQEGSPDILIKSPILTGRQVATIKEQLERAGLFYVEKRLQVGTNEFSQLYVGGNHDETLYFLAQTRKPGEKLFMPARQKRTATDSAGTEYSGTVIEGSSAFIPRKTVSLEPKRLEVPRLTPLPVLLAEGQTMMDALQFDSAYTHYSKVVRDYPDSIEANFMLGMSAFNTKRYPHAMMAYERALTLDPNLDRVRLELGRTYFVMGQYNSAKREFENVLAHRPPSTVEEKIRQFLTAVDSAEKRFWINGFVSLGVMHDSNANAGVDSDQIVLNGLQFRMSKDSQKKASWGGFGLANIATATRLGDSKKWFFVADVAGYMKDYTDADSDLTSLKGNAGIRFAYGNHLAEVRARAEKIFYDHDDLMDVVGAEGLYAYTVNPSLVPVLRWRAEHRDNTLDLKDSNYFEIAPSLRFFMLEKMHTFEVGGKFFKEDAKAKQYSNTGFEANGQIRLNMPWDGEIYSWGFVKRTNYDAPGTTILDYDRRDTMYNIGVGTNKKLDFLLPGLVWDANVMHLKNDSNTALYDFDNTGVQTSIQYSF